MMDRLPDEVLLHVLSFLETKDLVRCSGIGRRWQRLTQDKTLWPIIDLSSCTIPFRALGTLLQRHGHVKSLVLHQSTVVDPVSWRKPFPKNELQTINLSEAVVSARVIGHLLKSTHQLIELNVSGCVINSTAYKAIASNMQLRNLNISSCKLSSGGFQTIFNRHSALDEVDLSKIPALYVQLKHIRSSTLRRLCVKDCDLEVFDIKRLVKHCPKLTHLDISWNFVGSSGTRKLKNRFPFLVEVLNCDDDFSDMEYESDYLSVTDSEWDTTEDDSNQQHYYVT